MSYKEMLDRIENAEDIVVGSKNQDAPSILDSIPWISRYDWANASRQLKEDAKWNAISRKTLLDSKALSRPHTEYGEFSISWPFIIEMGARIDTSAPVTIGVYFLMECGAAIIRHSHHIYSEIPMLLQSMAATLPSMPLNIGADVWLQRNSIVLPEVSEIHEGSILLAGSVLIQNTTCPHGIWGGNPATFIRIREPGIPVGENTQYAKEQQTSA